MNASDHSSIRILRIEKRRFTSVYVLENGDEYELPTPMLRLNGLRSGDYCTVAEMKELISRNAVPAAFSASCRILSIRSRSIHEIKTFLLSRSYPEWAVERIISMLKEYGYVDDEQFAESLVRQRFASGHGDRRIRFDLRQRGIAESQIESAIHAADSDTIRLGYEHALEKALRGKNAADPKDRKKVIAALMRRGYDYHSILSSLKSES